MQGPVELAGELVGGDAHTGQEVGATYIADEERVAGQHRHRIPTRALAHHDADRLGRMTGRRSHLELDVAQ